MARVLIFYLMRNSGHHSAARAIASALQKADPSGAVLCVNPMENMHAHLSAVIGHTYMTVIRQLPDLWGAVYDSEAAHRLAVRIRQLVRYGAGEAFTKLISDFRPDTVVCTQAYPFMLADNAQSETGLVFRLMGVVTDYLPHRFWMDGARGSYVVANEESAQRLQSFGVHRNRIRVFGIPIDPAFAEGAVPYSPNPPNVRPQVLVMGGSRGLGIRYSAIQALDRSDADFAIEAITGSNDVLRRRLITHHDGFAHRLRVRGSVRNIADLMRRATLLISKPGGLTSAEAMSLGLPMLLVRPLPGQEERNAEVLVGRGAALHLKNVRDVASVVTMLLNNHALLSMMKERARSIGRPNAAAQIAQEILHPS